jgi:hypothetical protein
MWCSFKVPLGLLMTHGTAMLTSIVLGQSPVVPTAAEAVQPHPSYTTVVAGGSQATTTAYTCRIPVLQVREVWTLRLRLPHQAGQLTASFNNHGEPLEGLVEGPSTVV